MFRGAVMYHILIIEDDVEINRLLTEFLEENGYYVVSQYNGLHILDILQENKTVEITSQLCEIISTILIKLMNIHIFH